jgi:hypothetical protein
VVPIGQVLEKNCGKTFASADERKAHFIQEHGFTSKPATPPLKSSLNGKGNKVKFVKSQRLVGNVHRVQTKTPKRQLANDSGDNSDSSIRSDSSMSVEAASRALIWRNDTTSSKKGRKVSHLRNVSTIHSVRKSRRLSEKWDNNKPDAKKASSEPEAVVPPAGQTAPVATSTSSTQPTSSTQSRRLQRPADTAETRRRREEECYGYSLLESQDHDSRTNTSQRLTSTHAEQSLKASNSLLEFRNGIAIAHQTKNSRSCQLRRVSYGPATLTKQYNHSICTTPRMMTQTVIANRFYTNHHDAEAWPYSLGEIIHEYDTEDEGQRGYERDSQDRFFENHTHPLHQYLAYLDDGGRRRYVLTDTGEERNGNPDSNSRKATG